MDNAIRLAKDAFEKIINFSDTEMEDGDAARLLAAETLLKLGFPPIDDFWYKIALDRIKDQSHGG